MCHGKTVFFPNITLYSRAEPVVGGGISCGDGAMLGSDEKARQKTHRCRLLHDALPVPCVHLHGAVTGCGSRTGHGAETLLVLRPVDSGQRGVSDLHRTEHIDAAACGILLVFRMDGLEENYSAGLLLFLPHRSVTTANGPGVVRNR